MMIAEIIEVGFVRTCCLQSRRSSSKNKASGDKRHEPDPCHHVKGFRGLRCQHIDMIPAEHGVRSSRILSTVIVSM
jgi:hypothetical protein